MEWIHELGAEGNQGHAAGNTVLYFLAGERQENHVAYRILPWERNDAALFRDRKKGKAQRESYALGNTEGVGWNGAYDR